MKNKTIIIVYIALFLLIGASITPIINGNDIKITQTDNTEPLTISNTDWWPMAHHGPQNTGYSTSSTPNLDDCIITWSRVFPGDVGTIFESSSSPVVYNNKIYVYEDGYYSRLICVDADTGEDVWEYFTNGTEKGHSPAIGDNKIFFGNGIKLGHSGDVICLNAETGEKIWNYTTGDHVGAAPTLEDDRLYVGSYDHKIYCFDSDPFDDGIDEGYNDPLYANYDLIWSYDTGFPIYKTPAVSDGRVVVVTYRCVGGTVFCLDAATGERLWYGGYNAFISSPVVVDGRIYLGGISYAPYTQGRVSCVDVDDSSVVYWEYIVDFYRFYSTPAVAYGRVYIANGNKHLYCIDAEDGDVLWEANDVVYKTSPAVADGKVYMFSRLEDDAPQVLQCFDVFNGNLLWEHHLVRGGAPFASSPVIANGKIHIVTTETGNRWSIHTFEEGQNHPPDPPTITGPEKGKVGYGVYCNFTTNDPDGNGIYYYIDWGNGDIFKPDFMRHSGEESTVMNFYWRSGTYKIKAKAVDTNNAESDWSEPFIIEITKKSKSCELSNFNFFRKLFKEGQNLYPLLRNLLMQFLSSNHCN